MTPPPLTFVYATTLLCTAPIFLYLVLYQLLVGLCLCCCAVLCCVALCCVGIALQCCCIMKQTCRIWVHFHINSSELLLWPQQNQLHKNLVHIMWHILQVAFMNCTNKTAPNALCIVSSKWMFPFHILSWKMKYVYCVGRLVSQANVTGRL